MKKLSIILPAYNEEGMVNRAFEQVNNILSNNSISFEIIFVNDGSTDDTWLEILEVSKEHRNVKGVNFSRNFGKEAAIRAGLYYASGDCAVVMDCDMQHPPETILEMYDLWVQGYQIVEGVKISRGKENIINKISSKLFYQVLKKITGFKIDRSSDFKLLDRQVIEEYLHLPEKKMFFRAITFWMGFNSIEIEYEVREREIGTSKWSMMSLIKYAFNNITSFSTAPMQIITIIGVVNLILSLVLGIQSLINYIKGYSLEGFTTVILLLLLIGSSLMISLGIIGFYLSKIYEEVKGRPSYIVSNVAAYTKPHEKDKVSKENEEYFSNI
ncbi:glycosyltransferase family 2 protein [Solibacillus sp. FSL K6-1523]|uniref:glycosyltransferase family 2 protein n=1 Tax=Solibacillus sp. FSL K6-1523 TaxID=2921471 RepID=UPI0030FAE807